VAALDIATVPVRSPDTSHLLPTTPEVDRGVAGLPDSGLEVQLREVGISSWSLTLIAGG
jgi:hypothetical protein